jgi:hypothetical protein
MIANGLYDAIDASSTTIHVRLIGRRAKRMKWGLEERKQTKSQVEKSKLSHLLVPRNGICSS